MNRADRLPHNESQKPAAQSRQGVQQKPVGTAFATTVTEFNDGRTAAVTQRKLQEAAAHSPRSMKTRQLQSILSRSPHPASLPLQKKSNSTGLPDDLKSGIENLSGHAMDDVKVHYNSGKPAQQQAHAYAQGRDIHVAPGQERHLPHEAWHVVQQAQGRVQATTQMAGVAVNDDARLEREADVMGAQALSTGQVAQQAALPVQARALGAVAGVVQRQLDPDAIEKLVKFLRLWYGPADEETLELQNEVYDYLVENYDTYEEAVAAIRTVHRMMLANRTPVATTSLPVTGSGMGGGFGKISASSQLPMSMPTFSHTTPYMPSQMPSQMPSHMPSHMSFQTPSHTPPHMSVPSSMPMPSHGLLPGSTSTNMFMPSYMPTPSPMSSQMPLHMSSHQPASSHVAITSTSMLADDDVFDEEFLAHLDQMERSSTHDKKPSAFSSGPIVKEALESKSNADTAPVLPVAKPSYSTFTGMAKAVREKQKPLKYKEPKQAALEALSALSKANLLGAPRELIAEASVCVDEFLHANNEGIRIEGTHGLANKKIDEKKQLDLMWEAVYGLQGLAGTSTERPAGISETPFGTTSATDSRGGGHTLGMGGVTVTGRAGSALGEPANTMTASVALNQIYGLSFKNAFVAGHLVTRKAAGKASDGNVTPTPGYFNQGGIRTPESKVESEIRRDSVISYSARANYGRTSGNHSSVDFKPADLALIPVSVSITIERRGLKEHGDASKIADWTEVTQSLYDDTVPLSLSQVESD